MKSHFFVDMHCHPSIKAYARSFADKPGIQSNNPADRSSIWHRDVPSFFDKIKNYVVGLTNFIQSDASSLLKGRVCVVCLSFYPQEKGFFINKAGTGIVSDTLTKLASEFGQERIDHLQQLDSYWNDLKMEMDFLRQQENKIIHIDGKKVSYEIANSYEAIEAADRGGKLGETKVIFIPTIEGGHIFDQVMDCHEIFTKYPKGIPEDKLAIVLDRIRELREGRNNMIRPVFITLAHHFWNGLCGQARSLSGLVKFIVDQENGLESNFTEAGKEVVIALLREEKDATGKVIPPVYIDIKHMNRISRSAYFDLLKHEFEDRNFPIIVSHGGVTGLSKENGERKTAASQEGLFMDEPINFFDDELIAIERTNGIFGIQLDERRIGSKQAIRNAKEIAGRRRTLYSWAKLVWNQVRHIAEVLDLNGRYAWGIQTLGMDFDGIIDPIDGYWTASEIDHLDDYLLMHAHNYLTAANAPCPLLQERNKMVKPEEIIERVMTSNGLGFLARFL